MVLSNDNPDLHSFDQLSAVVAASADTRMTKRALHVATQLTIHGMADKAEVFIKALRDHTKSQFARDYLIRLESIRANLGGQDIWDKVQQKDHILRHLLGFNSIYLPRPDSRHLIIVFSAAYNNFGVSFPLLHLTLSKRPVAILYIKNPDKGLYCTGSPGMGGNIDEMGRYLKKFCEDNPFSKVSVLGFSSGGYASLFAAGCIGASSFIGFGIRTDWSLACPHPISPGRVSPEAGQYATNTLANLRHADNMATIGQASLYYGAADLADTYQAENMRDLPNFKVHRVENSPHNVIVSLAAENRFAATLEEIL